MLFLMTSQPSPVLLITAACSRGFSNSFSLFFPHSTSFGLPPVKYLSYYKLISSWLYEMHNKCQL